MKKSIVLGDELKNELKCLATDASEINPYLFFSEKDTTDNYISLVFTLALPTTAFTEEEYNDYIELLDNLDIIRDKYSIMFGWDNSGYDYWTNQMKEDLFVEMSVFIYDDMDSHEIDDFIRYIYSIGEKVDAFEMNIWKTDDDYKKRLDTNLF